jgi:hypothetical protein
VQRAAEAVLVADRHHHPGGEERSEEIAQPRLCLARAGRGGKPLGVVALREGDGGGDAAKHRILLEQPRRLEVPPLGAVEEVIEAGAMQLLHLLGLRAERLGKELRLRVLRARGSDQLAPHLAGHLVGGIAAKAVKADAHVVAHQRLPALEQGRPLGPLVVVDLREVAPHGALLRVVGVDRVRRAHRAVRLTQEPLRVLLDQQRVLGGMIDHQIHHDRKPVCLGRLHERTELRVRIALAFEQRVQAVIVLHRIEAPREAGVMEWIHEHPVEAHARDPRQVLLPVRHPAREQGKKVVDAWPFTHRSISMVGGARAGPVRLRFLSLSSDAGAGAGAGATGWLTSSVDTKGTRTTAGRRRRKRRYRSSMRSAAALVRP